MNKIIGNNWDNILKKEFNSEYFKELQDFLDEEYKKKIIYPAKENIFNSLKLTEPDKVKVVILGQDPYINPGQAHGLAFSVEPDTKLPPSLKNIFKELNSDIGMPMPKCGYLLPWAEQGVLLLNTTFTVEIGKSNSHVKRGWEIFTDAIIKYIGEQNNPVAFLLWGLNARSKAKLIKSEKHLILEATHPSPLSAYSGFFGCRHFSKANKFLEENGLQKIDWTIDK